MSTHSVSVQYQNPQGSKALRAAVGQDSDVAGYVALAGRVLYSAVFVMAAFGHFSQQTIGYAAQQGVPMAQLLVPLSGVITFLGGLSILVGYQARVGAWVLAAFLVPATFMFHNFWAVQDPMMFQMQQAMFMKNLSIMGGAMLIAYFGAGPLSLDARRVRATVREV